MSEFSRNISDLNIIQGLSDLPNQDDNLTSDQLKAKFDEGVNILKQYVFSFLDELEGPSAAGKIGYDGAHSTIGEALSALEAAGVGTVPPDNTISTAKIQDEAITEAKLASTVAEKLNAVNVKFGTITPTYTGSSSTDEGASGYITENKWQEFDIGIEATTVILFKNGDMVTHNPITSTSGNSSIRPYGISFGERYTRGSSSYERYEYTVHGGIAQLGSPCMCNEYEVFKIDGCKIKTHKLTYVNSNNNDSDRYYIGTTDTLCYIAIV